MGKQTVTALLSRGIDSQLADRLDKKNYTLGKLQQLNEKELFDLGFARNNIELLRNGKRPPIPKPILYKVLHNNRRTCCICRDPKKPIIVHHIIEWSKSHSHEEDNLVVLCLEHHDLAHTKKELSQGLSIQQIRESKKKWENDVKRLDAKAILKLKSDNNFSRWDWINIPRVFEYLTKNELYEIQINSHSILRERNLIDGNGLLNPEVLWDVDREISGWFISFYEGMYIADYLSSIANTVLEKLPIIDITSCISNKDELNSIISEGDFIATQLGFYFKTIQKGDSERTEIRRAYYRGHGIIIEYIYKPWFCLSCSAKYCGMSGHKVQTIFGQVRSILENEGELVISISCFASGTAFGMHPMRSY